MFNIKNRFTKDNKISANKVSLENSDFRKINQNKEVKRALEKSRKGLLVIK